MKDVRYTYDLTPEEKTLSDLAESLDKNPYIAQPSPSLAAQIIRNVVNALQSKRNK